jgi:putative ABC transport system ATP-binding protein
MGVDGQLAADPLMARLCATELYRFFHNGDAETAALRGVSLEIRAGEFVALVGPSGSGKSTLLACLAGLDNPDGGTVTIDGERVSRQPEKTSAAMRARFIGMLMQSRNLLEHLTVQDNVRLQRRLARISSQSSSTDWLVRLGISDRRDALSSHLSGGETARAGLAVALAADPAILICDEPTAEVDAATEQIILGVFHECQRSGVAIIVATHSAKLAAAANRVVQIADGRLV